MSKAIGKVISKISTREKPTHSACHQVRLATVVRVRTNRVKKCLDQSNIRSSIFNALTISVPGCHSWMLRLYRKLP